MENNPYSPPSCSLKADYSEDWRKRFLWTAFALVVFFVVCDLVLYGQFKDVAGGSGFRGMVDFVIGEPPENLWERFRQWLST